MNLQIDKKLKKQTTKLIRVDVWWHRALKLYASDQGLSIRHYLEGILGDYIDLDHFKEIQKKL